MEDAFGDEFKQADTHPVVNVNWEDANAFCEWLTKKEMAAGKIKAGQKYRLPTDAEWSVAVGLGKEKGNTPGAKSQVASKMFTRGARSGRRLKGAGNYGGRLKVDKYDRTAPVGSFAANQLGLHDMGGNAWEWCEDWYDPSRQKRAVCCAVRLGTHLQSRQPVVVRPPHHHSPDLSQLQHRLSVCVGGWFRWVRLASQFWFPRKPPSPPSQSGP